MVLQTSLIHVKSHLNVSRLVPNFLNYFTSFSKEKWKPKYSLEWEFRLSVEETYFSRNSQNVSKNGNLLPSPTLISLLAAMALDWVRQSWISTIAQVHTVIIMRNRKIITWFCFLDSLLNNLSSIFKISQTLQI